MDVIETLLKLPESERQKLAEALMFYRNSTGKSGTDSKDSLNLSSNSPEKPVSKQKTLDNWIVKNKTPSSHFEKEVTHCKEIVPISVTGEASRTFEEVSSSRNSEEVSSTLPDQLTCKSSTPIEKASKSENVKEKKLMVLLNRHDCFESKQKLPEHGEFSFEKKSISSKEIKSPSEKHVHFSENSDKRNLSPEKHSPTPPRSYNLRSARVVPDEKTIGEASNSLVISLENEDKVHRLVTKQKPKSKNSVGKDAIPDSSTCWKEVKSDEKTDSCNDIMSKENNKNSECKMPSTVINSELEKTTNAISVDDKITITDENQIPSEFGVTLVVKGKRKRASKSKESKKLCVDNTAQKNSPNKIKVNNKNAESIPNKKVIELNENGSEFTIEKKVELSRTDASNSHNQIQISSNDAVESVSKLKLKKTTKRKDRNDLQEKSKLDSTRSKIKKKNLPNPEIDSNITKNVDLQKEVSDKQLKSATTSGSKECAKETVEFTKDVNSRKISRKRGSKNKSMKTTKDCLLPDSEMTPKINEKGSIGDDSTEISFKVFSFQNKESTKEIKQLLNKDVDTETLGNVDSKRISRKRGNEDKIMKTAKKSLLFDSELDSKNNEKDGVTSIKTSSKILPQNNEFAKKTEFLIKDANTVPTNSTSKKKVRKTGGENKIIVAAKNSISSDLGQVYKNNEEDSITSAEISSVDSSQSKECFKEAEKLLKDTNAATLANVGSKRTSRKRGTGNKSVVTTKNHLISASEQASKINDKDRITSIEKSSKILPRNNEFVKDTKEFLIKDTNIVIPLNVSSKKSFRQTGSEIKKKVIAKNSLSSDSGKASKSDKDSIISTETLTVYLSKNSSSQSKDSSTEAEELIKETNSTASVNLASKRTIRKRSTGKKCMVTTKISVISDSEQASKSSNKDSITSIETLETDSSKNSPSSVAKELSTKQTSSINTSTEKITLSLNECSHSVSLHSQSGDHSRKISLNSSNDELDSLNKMKESLDDQSQKSGTVSSNVPKSDENNTLHPQENSNLSGASKKVNALKKKVKAPANSRKKLKVTKDENLSSSPQSISENLDSEMENPDQNLKKKDSKKKVPFLKMKVVRDSNKEHSEVPVTKSNAKPSLNSNAAQEPKDKLLKNLNNKLAQGQKEKTRVENSKEVKESHSKKKSYLESQVSSINLSKNDEVEKLNSNLVEDKSFVKNKLCNTKINKKAPIKSTNTEKPIKDIESDSSSGKPTENEYLSKKVSEVQMELDSFHSVDKSKTCDNSTNADNSVDAENSQEMIPDISMDISDSSESEKAKYDIIRDMEEISGKEADLAVNDSNNTEVVQTDFENSVELDEKMRRRYIAFCKMKELLETTGISIKEVFENPKMSNSINSAPPDSSIEINKCNTDLKILFVCMNQKKEMNILNKLKTQ